MICITQYGYKNMKCIRLSYFIHKCSYDPEEMTTTMYMPPVRDLTTTMNMPIPALNLWGQEALRFWMRIPQLK